jgi:homoserine dehydrogenase
VVIDNTSSQHIANSYPEFLRRGISIATPNKKAFSGSSGLWRNIFTSAAYSNAFVYHESSVGAGMPIISTLNDMIQTGDEIVHIEGVFSGTMSYLFNNFSPVDGGDSDTWSEAVKKAKSLGYTEPDPRDDLNGLDVARKLTILGRIAGLPIESPTSFPVQSLIPKELEAATSSEEFLRKLPEFDMQMEAEKAAAARVGKVIRFVGKIDMVSGKASVGLEQFDKSHPVANLQGTDNIISFRTKRYNTLPLTIRGAGAGGEVTAMGVSSDLLKILSQIK